MKTKGWFVLLAIVGLALCGGPIVEAAVKDTLTIALGSDVDNLDPHMFAHRESVIVTQHIYDALVYRDPDTMQLTPHLATSWRVINPLTWEFNLRKDVKFHNGEPFTAQTVKFNYDRMLNPEQKAPQRGLHLLIKRVEVVDESTVRIHTEKPYPLMIERLATLRMGPEKYIKEKGDAYVAEHPVGTGVYKFVRWDRGRQIVLVASDTHFRFKPAFKNAVWRIIPETATAIADLLSGAVDIIRAVPPDQMEVIDRSGVAKTVVVQNLRVAEVFLDAKGRSGQNPFTDKRVRQAINYGVNVDGILKNIVGDRGDRTAAALSPLHFGYDSSIKPYPYDPERAKRLLAEAGHPNGFEVRYISQYFQTPGQKQVAQAIASDLAKIGVRARIQHYEDMGPVVTMIRENKAGPMFQMSWGSFSVFDADALLYDMFHCGSIWTYYCNPELDKLLEQGRGTLDPEVRKKLYSQAQQIIKEDAPWLFLWGLHGIWGVSNKIAWMPSRDEVDRLFIATPK